MGQLCGGSRRAGHFAGVWLDVCASERYVVQFDVCYVVEVIVAVGILAVCVFARRAPAR